MLITCPCKVNIGLHVTSRRPDGYHNIQTVFYPVPLRDTIELESLPDTFPADYEYTAFGARVADNPEHDLVVRVYRSLREEFHLPPVRIVLRKNIPMGAGLGGGSSDAAGMMAALNELFDLHLSRQEQERRLVIFGADCPFFVSARPVYATGIGNVFTPIDLRLSGWNIVLVKPPFGVGTKEAYAGVTPAPARNFLPDLLLRHPVTDWREMVFNDFEPSIFALYPTIAAIKSTLYDMGAAYAAMSGSGSTVFALFARPVEELVRVFPDCFTFQKTLI